MELIYPFILIIGIPIIIFLAVSNLKSKDLYENGKKIANTKYIKELPYYKNIFKKYKILTYIIQGICLMAIIMSLILLSRPAKIDTKGNPMYARDIFLCMDVSQSVDELNIELVGNLKKTVNSLKGERFGISIFNTSSVLICPLTDDYKYVINELDKIYNSLDINIKGDSSLENWGISEYIVSGTIEGADERGSSLIGEGLASCVYNFSNLEEQRSRVIIFSTDNDLAGESLITLQNAAKLCKEKNIIVFGIAPDTINEEDENELKKAVESTGGKYYTMSSRNQVKSIVESIENTSKNLIEGQVETRKIDQPQIPFCILLISIIVLFILDKKVNL